MLIINNNIVLYLYLMYFFFFFIVSILFVSRYSVIKADKTRMLVVLPSNFSNFSLKLYKLI